MSKTSREKQKSSTSHRAWVSLHDCAVCGSKAIGINFAVPTCAPCKAFFRRNARRREILQMPCQIWDGDGDFSTDENKEQSDMNSRNCTQLRRCTSCRLRRCFNVGMKEELVRTEEEKLRYKLLIETNRQRRREVSQQRGNSQKIPQILTTYERMLNEDDWRLLSNIVSAYDNYCLKFFTEHQKTMFEEELKYPDRALSKVDHHIKTRVNNIKAYLSFLSSLPVIQSLSIANRFYLCKHNIRSLIFLNAYELEQACFSEIWQSNVDDAAAEEVYGKILFVYRQRVKNQATSVLINDPAVTRLWLLILFFSAPLNCHYDRSLPEISKKNRLDINDIQNSFTVLLWNYLVHRHGSIDAVRIFSNLIRIYLQMQQFSRAVNHQARTRRDLFVMNEAFNRAVISEMDI